MSTGGQEISVAVAHHKAWCPYRLSVERRKSKLTRCTCDVGMGLSWRMAQALTYIADGRQQTVGLIGLSTYRALEHRRLIAHKCGPFSPYKLTAAGYRAINREMQL